MGASQHNTHALHHTTPHHHADQPQATLGTSFRPSVRSVCLSGDCSKILVGTRGSEIFELSATDGSDINQVLLVVVAFVRCCFSFEDKKRRNLRTQNRAVY